MTGSVDNFGNYSPCQVTAAPLPWTGATAGQAIQSSGDGSLFSGVGAPGAFAPIGLKVAEYSDRSTSKDYHWYLDPVTGNYSWHAGS